MENIKRIAKKLNIKYSEVRDEIEITDIVYSKTKDYIILHGNNPVTKCYFDNTDVVDKIKLGSKITIVGNIDVDKDNNPNQLKNCKIK